MPAIKKSDVLDDSVKKAFDDLNASVRLSVDLLVLMTKNAKDINASLGNGSNLSQVAAANEQYSATLKDQIKYEQEVIKLERMKIALAKDQEKASETSRKAAESEIKAAKAKEDAIKKEAKAKELAVIQKEKADQKEAAASAKAAAQIIKDNERKAAADAKAAKEAEKAAKQSAQNASAYANESKRLNELRQKAKDIAMTYGESSKQFKAAAREVQNLDSKLKKIDSTLGQSQRNVGNYKDGWKSFGAGLLGGFGITLGLTAIAGGIKSVVESSMAFEKSLSSLRAITGVSAKEMDFFRQKALMMSKDSVKSAVEIVKAFELVGSKAPELLKDKDALAAVTEQSVILSEATGGQLGLEESVNAVTAAMNTFGISSLEAGRIAAVFAAGSKEGSAEVSSLTESFKNAGTVAASANMTLEETVAMLEVLGEKSIYGAEAGTKMRGSILKLQDAQLGYQSGSFKLQDALDEANKKMAALGSEMEKDAYKAKIFGAENVTVGTIMIENVGKFDKLTTAITGTNTAVEQQSIQNDNLSTSMTKLGNAWDGWMLNLSKSTGVLKKTFDIVTGIVNTLSFQSLDNTGQAAELAATKFAQLNKEIGSLSINEQIGKIEADLKKMNQTLKETRETAANEGVDIEKGIKGVLNTAVLGAGSAVVTGYKSVYAAMTGEQLASAKVVYNSNQILAQQLQDRLNALYAEQMKQEDGTQAIKEDTDATKENTAAKKEANKQAMEPVMPKEMDAKETATVEARVDKSDLNDKLLEDAMSFAKTETQIYKDELDQQIRDLEEAEAQKAELRSRWADEIYNGITTIEDAIWDNVAMSRDDAMNAEIEAMQSRLDNEKLDEEQRAEIQKQIDEKERQIKIKNAKAEKQDALMRVAIDTALGIGKIKVQAAILMANPLTFAYGLAALAEIPFVIASGAAQTAAISIRKIPEYAEGTDNHPGGMAVVGDGGKSELVETPSGAKFLTPATDTIINLPKGSKVTPGEEVAERLNELTRREIIGLSLPSNIDKAQHALLTRLIDEQIRTRDAIKNQPQHRPVDVRGAVKLELFKQSLKN